EVTPRSHQVGSRILNLNYSERAGSAAGWAATVRRGPRTGDDGPSGASGSPFRLRAAPALREAAGGRRGAGPGREHQRLQGVDELAWQAAEAGLLAQHGQRVLLGHVRSVGPGAVQGPPGAD